MTQEFRQNKLTGQWVIFSTARGDRPNDFRRIQPERVPLPQHDESCPFCPGNEHMLDDVIMETMLDQHWQVRVVPNKFPMLTEEAGDTREQRGIFIAMPGSGKHEVIIDHPRHDFTLADMGFDELLRVVDTYYWRYVTLLAQNNSMNVLIFRNHGKHAGASLAHPHSQLVVTSIVPPVMRLQDQRSQEYFDTWGRNLMADILKQEIEDGVRIVLENEAFVSLVPYAAEVPYEIWIVPRRPQADFGELADDEMKHFTRILQNTLRLLRDKLADPDYNFVVRSAPRYKADEPHLCWYLQIRPRLVTRAGFELGTGLSVNPTLPETAAAMLRGD